MSISETLKKNKLRLVTGFIIGWLTLFCVILGGIPLMIFSYIFSYCCSKEWVQILNNKGFHPSLSVMHFVNIMFVLLATFNKLDLMASVLAFGTIIAFLAVLFKGRQPYIANIATTIAGFVYCGWLPCHILMMRKIGAHGLGLLSVSDNVGLGLLVLVFFTILLTDIGAYYTGSKLGKTPLCPVVSPKKTVEGAVGGAVFAVLTALIVGYIIHLEWYYALIAGILVTIFAQIGDLCESLIKRDAGVKDSGNSLPGHGGFLDRVDSYMFSAPVAYYFFKYFVVSHNLWYDFVDLCKMGLNFVGF